ncbi:MAG: FG-GAP-like repeat-containing protein [Planctomycetota bacterium]
MALICTGCDSASETAETKPADAKSAGERSARPVDHLATARRKLDIGDFGAASDAALKALVENPDNPEATLIAAEAELGRGNRQRSAELAAAIELDAESSLAPRVVEIHARSLFELNRTSDAADVLLGGLELRPTQTEWRHRVWGLLSRVGRREEASRQAARLCRDGENNTSELNSLVRRTEAYPTVLPNNGDPQAFFDAGLGMARWHFTRREYRRALDELQQEADSGFSSAAAAALYGRLLSETQQIDQIPKWLASTDRDSMESLGDYWAALGTYFFDTRQYDASAASLLKAVYLNPTDRWSTQRLAKVFDALGNTEQGEQFRRRGVELAQCEGISDKLQAATRITPELLQAENRLMQQLLELERPFEAIAWALQLQPSQAIARRRQIEQQRAAFLREEETLEIASVSALLGLERKDYPLGPAYEDLVRASQSPDGATEDKEVTPLAIPRLVDVAAKVGLDFQWYRTLQLDESPIPIHESIGGAIAVLDYDLDGWPDVYFAQGSGEPPTDECTRSNVLSRNVDGRFSETTSAAGCEDRNYGSGLAVGDVNQDGFPDLFLGSLGRNRLLINNGDGTFRDATNRLGDAADRFTSSLAIGDINGDALPDLFEAIYIEMEGAFALPKIGADGQPAQPSPLEHYAQSDRWYANDGNGDFRLCEISRDVAVPGTSLGVVVADFDGDGGNEVFVGNDVRPNHLLVHTGTDQLANAADAKGIANGFRGAANGCMGIATGDFNLDGTLDLHITNFTQESANLYLQSPVGGFTDFATRYRLDRPSMPMVGFGTKAIDVDRDGWLDLAVTNGHIFDMTESGDGYRMPPQFLANRGTHFEQVEVQDESGYWNESYLGRAMAKIDFDCDGDSDLLINHLDRPNALLQNETQTVGGWLQLELVGTKSERDAIGAKVTVSIGTETRSEWVVAGDGYLCSDQAILEFGLGKDAEEVTLEINWPSGAIDTLVVPEVNERYLVIEGSNELNLR